MISVKDLYEVPVTLNMIKLGVFLITTNQGYTRKYLFLVELKQSKR